MTEAKTGGQLVNIRLQQELGRCWQQDGMAHRIRNTGTQDRTGDLQRVRLTS